MKNKFTLVSIPFILLGIGLFYGAMQFIQPAPKKEITIATGSKAGQYYQNALKYKRVLEKEKVKVNIINTSGSLENIELIKKQEVDVAFIQNGTVTQDSSSNFQALASIYYEPLWVFYRKKRKNVELLQDFIGTRIAWGADGSGTRDLAGEILHINGIDSLNSKLLNYGTTQSVEGLLDGSVDVAFMAISAASPIIKNLLSNEAIDLFSFERSQAYSKNFVYLEPVDFHEGIINLSLNIPSENKKLLATTATLVAHNDFPDELVRILLRNIKSIHAPKSLFAYQNEFPNGDHFEMTLNDEASRYLEHGDSFLESIFPFWIASTLDRMKILLIPLVMLLLPIIKGIQPLYKWSIRSKIYKWYKEVRALDLLMDSSNKEELKAQIDRLEELKKEMKKVTNVPLSYMGEYYSLVAHLELMLSKARLKISGNVSKTEPVQID